MAATIVSEQNTDGFVFASSDAEFEQHLQEAVEASNDDFAFCIQLEEALYFSIFTFAYDLQLAEIGLSPVYNPSISTEEAASSSHLMDEEEHNIDNYSQQDNVVDGENTGKTSGKEVCTLPESSECSIPAAVERCGICYEDSTAEMFGGIQCFHRFCHSCMTKYIHMRLEQKRHQILCPHESCDESLIPQECRYFLPVEIMEAWNAIILEAEIPESQKMYCPFPDCSKMLLKENVAGEETFSAECSFCNRMFCVRCLVPWHADFDCEEFQKIPPEERSEDDLQLFKLAEARKWQRCSKCKSMIELNHGCNHMTCRCGHEFCYGCGTEWAKHTPNCN